MIEKIRFSGPLIKHFIKSLCLLTLFFFASVAVYAAENHLITSVSLQQDFTSNYLMSHSNPEELLGEYVIPALEYQYSNLTDSYFASLQGSIQRFNRPEFNGEYPMLKLGFKKNTELSRFSIDYDVNIQSTRVSELNDSGNFEKKTSDRIDRTVSLTWQTQSSETSRLSISGSQQVVNYESDTYADINSRFVLARWQYQARERVNFYVTLSDSQYEAKLLGNFPIAPELLQGHYLCPPNSILVSQYACSSFTPIAGYAVNDTAAKAFQFGIDWDIQEHLKLTAGAGMSPSNTVQNIHSPEIIVSFGQPIDREVIFGGQHAVKSTSKVKLANLSLNYINEKSSVDVSFDSKIQPSSTGTIWKTTSAKVGLKHSTSQENWLSASLNYSNFESLDEKFIGSTFNRNFFDTNFGYTYLFNETLMSTFSVGYRFQKEKASSGNEADAILASIAINYVPRGWTW